MSVGIEQDVLEDDDDDEKMDVVEAGALAVVRRVYELGRSLVVA